MKRKSWLAGLEEIEPAVAQLISSSLDNATSSSEASLVLARHWLWAHIHSTDVDWSATPVFVRSAYAMVSLGLAGIEYDKGNFIKALEYIDTALIFCGEADKEAHDALVARAEDCKAAIEDTPQAKRARVSRDAETVSQLLCSHPSLVCVHNQLSWAPVSIPRGALDGVRPPIAIQKRSASDLDLESFFTQFLSTEQPVVVSDGMQHWPALRDENRRWCHVSRLSQRLQNRLVTVEHAAMYTSADFSHRFMQGGQLIEAALAQSQCDVAPAKKVYLAQHRLFSQIPKLGLDVCVPEYVAFSETGADVRNVWIGPRGTVTPCHNDPHPNFLCQVVGRKFVRLFLKSETRWLSPGEGVSFNTSTIDIMSPNTTAHPNFINAQPLDCVLEPGHMLFIPQGCWHYVQALDFSISVNFFF